MKKKIKQKGPRINQQIRAPMVELIDEQGKHHDSIPTPVALSRAQEVGLSLVEIKPDYNKPLCKIMDYGKFKYEESKKAAVQRKKSREGTIKEFQVRPNIGQHDLNIKIKHAREAALDGHKIKIVLTFSRREMLHKDVGMVTLEKFMEALQDVTKIFAPSKSEGQRVVVLLSPTVKKDTSKNNGNSDKDNDDIEEDELIENNEDTASEEDEESAE